jgi:hypothetical protein
MSKKDSKLDPFFGQSFDNQGASKDGALSNVLTKVTAASSTIKDALAADEADSAKDTIISESPLYQPAIPAVVNPPDAADKGRIIYSAADDNYNENDPDYHDEPFHDTSSWVKDSHGAGKYEPDEDDESSYRQLKYAFIAPIAAIVIALAIMFGAH